MIRTTRAHSARTAPRRRGVTLVEMLVATAMCILGMWMLTWMFQQATASFSLANAQATLTGHERLVTTIMTRDIDNDRFPEDEPRPNRGRRLSDLQGNQPRRGGYFIARSRVAQPAGAGIVNIVEGPDPGLPNPTYKDLYGFQSSRSTDHFIQFTTILPDTPGNRYFAEVLTPTRLVTTAGVAAEISYYLVATGRQTPTGVPLFDLIRVQRIVAQGTADRTDYLRDVVTPGYAAGDTVDEVMASAPGPQMFTLKQLGDAYWTNAPRFTGVGTARGAASRRFGEDRLMTDVLSIEIKFTGYPGQTLTAPRYGSNDAWPLTNTHMPNSPLVWPRPLVEDRSPPPAGAPYPGNADFPYDNLPYDGRFDTNDPDGARANPASYGPPAMPGGPPAYSPVPTRQSLVITGVQIRIRAFRSGTTRQSTLTLAL